jgi:hypothetical protein
MPHGSIGVKVTVTTGQQRTHARTTSDTHLTAPMLLASATFVRLPRVAVPTGRV